MNKLGRLIRNEIIKKIKQPSTIILALVFIVFCTLLPFFAKANEYIYDYDYDIIEKDIESYQWRYDWEAQKGGNGEIELPDYVVNQYDDAINFLKKFTGKGISYEDWRYSLIQETTRKIQSNYVIGLILDDKLDTHDKEKLQYLEDPTGYTWQLEYPDKEILQSEFDENKSFIDKMTKIIEENDYKYYVSNLIETIKSSIDVSEKQLETLKEKQSKTPSKETEKEIKNLETQIGQMREALKIPEYRLEKDIPLDNSWKDKTLNALEYNLQQITGLELELESLKEPGRRNDFDYLGLTTEDQIKIVEKQIAKTQNMTMIYWASLEKDTPEIGVAASSRNNSLNYMSMTIFSAIISLFIAASMVSNEFSTKTINMLVIRPVKRWKILTAKYITVLIFAYGIYFIGMLGYMLSIGLNYGFTDFANPYMFVSGGTVHSMNFFIHMLLKVLMHSSNIVFLVTLAFMMSTLTKNTALSAITSMGAYFIGSIVTSIVIFAAPKMIGVLKHTFLPYVDLNTIIPSNTGGMMGGYNDIMSFLYDPIYGMIHLFVLSAVMFAVSLIVFNKRDVK